MPSSKSDKSRATLAAKAAALRGLPRCSACAIYFHLAPRGFTCRLARCPQASRHGLRLASEGGLELVRPHGDKIPA